MFSTYSKKIAILFTLCLVCVFSFSHTLYADEIVIGGNSKDGWSKLEQKIGVTEGTGRYGYKCIQLATDSRVKTSLTDALIDFESKSFSKETNTNTFRENTGNYVITKDNFGISNKAAMGHNAGLARGSGGIILKGNDGSIFGTEGPTGSFYIEFWLSPSLSENGELLLKWQTSRNINKTVLYQMIAASFLRNHVEWSFTNIFDDYAKEIKLIGKTTIVPSTWTHHCISFNEENGRLEYRVDGMLEDIKYVTSTGHDSGTVHQAFLGVPAEIELCPKFTGMIDDFRIQRGTYDVEKQQESENASGLKYLKYNRTGGRIVTEPLLASTGAILNSVTAILDEPKQTAVHLYVRIGDNHFDWTDDYPQWKPITSGEKLTDKKMSGLYFQVAADLFPDGSGEKTPSITQLTIDYTKLPEPLPPFSLKATPGDSSVTISWNYSVDETAGGYYVYYGTRPGEYLGRVALEGNSPINVGNTSSVTLTGLKNGTIYYFAVATYSKLDERIVGQLSREVYARPALEGIYE